MTTPMGLLQRPPSPKPSKNNSACEWRGEKLRSKSWSSTTWRKRRPKTDPALLLRLEGDRSVRLELPVIAEIDRVPAAVAGSAHAAQCFGVNRKQELLFADQHVIVIDRGFHRIEWKALRDIPRLHFDSQHAEGFLVDPDGALVGWLVRFR